MAQKLHYLVEFIRFLHHPFQLFSHCFSLFLTPPVVLVKAITSCLFNHPRKSSTAFFLFCSLPLISHLIAMPGKIIIYPVQHSSDRAVSLTTPLDRMQTAGSASCSHPGSGRSGSGTVGTTGFLHSRVWGKSFSKQVQNITMNEIYEVSNFGELQNLSSFYPT